MAKIDRLQRVKDILKQISKGKSRTQISEYLKEKYKISNTTIERDFALAYEQLKDDQSSYNIHIKEIILERYETIWQKAMEKNDLKSACIILKQISSLFGLETNKQEVTVKQEEPVEIIFI